jgi:hypothetical protein
VRENPVAAGVALGTGVTGAGGSVLVARRKKG